MALSMASAFWVATAVAMQPPLSSMSRRAAIAAGLAASLPQGSVRAEDIEREGGALGATCLGFGCNPYKNTDFNGLPSDLAPAGSMPYQDFLAALKANKVELVIFEPPSGDEAYAVIDGLRVRIGEGWPVEVTNSWSSPTWVVRILQNEGVPYKWNFDLKAKPKVRAGSAPEPYVPRYPKGVNGLTGGAIYDAPPKMYGGADSEMERLSGGASDE
jgi:hypothetical protein